MFTDVTYQDWLAASAYERDKLLLQIVTLYKASAGFRAALDARQYFNGDNPTVAKKTILKASATETRDEKGRRSTRWVTKDVVGNRIANSFFSRFVLQQNQFVLTNGVTMKEKEKLGIGFDRVLEYMGENALICGVSWGFWNVDHLEFINAAANDLSGAVALLDERTGLPMVLVQFWQINPKKPMHIRLFEVDGVTSYRVNEGDLVTEAPKRAYVLHTVTDTIGTVVEGQSNYSALPVIPLYANSEQRSELTESIRAKIDAYDTIASDLSDNLDRANDVYWVLNNFGGGENDVARMLEEINRIKAVVNYTDGTGSGSTAEPRTIEVPYQARQTAMELLRKALYADYMALDMTALTGGSLTNVAIKAAMADMNMKANRFEWQCFQFVQSVLRLIGIETEEIRFTRQSIINDSEVIANIYMMRQDIDRRTALELNPYIIPEQVEDIMTRVAEEESTNLSEEELNRRLEEMRLNEEGD